MSCIFVRSETFQTALVYIYIYIYIYIYNLDTKNQYCILMLHSLLFKHNSKAERLARVYA